MIKAPGKSDGQTGTKILLEAMSKDQVHLARFVLDALDGEIVDSRAEGAQTPLITSILLPDGHARCKFVELLLQRGAAVNCQDDSGRTALSYACEKGCLDAVKILVRNNADPEIVDVWGNTALMYAAVEGHSPVVEFLVRAFKRLSLLTERQNKVGNSAVKLAKFLGHTECFSALTNNAKKGRGAEALRHENPPFSLGGTETNDNFERKVRHVVKKLEVLQTCNHGEDLSVQSGARPSRPRMKQSRLPSMDSIEEFESENDCSSPSQALIFSRVLTPKPPPRTSDHFPVCKHSKATERLTAPEDHLPLLFRGCEPQKSVFFSPRLGRNSHKPSASTALGILLTPILPHKAEKELEKEKSQMSDFGVRRFHDSYYQKRCSLPCSILSVPTPPERTLAALQKSRTVRRRTASPSKAEALELTTPATATFTVLRNKLLRRFTSPELKKDTKELENDPGRIPRSETFPLDIKHPKVGSKPSIDSISSVKCEFDFHFRTPPS